MRVLYNATARYFPAHKAQQLSRKEKRVMAKVSHLRILATRQVAIAALVLVAN